MIIHKDTNTGEVFGQPDCLPVQRCFKKGQLMPELAVSLLKKGPIIWFGTEYGDFHYYTSVINLALNRANANILCQGYSVIGGFASCCYQGYDFSKLCITCFLV